MTLDPKYLAIVAGIAGAYVIVSELPFWAQRSSLAPVLTALGVSVVALALIQFARPPR
jgi:hypothetical protein